jgi:hypothetical protein
LNDKFGLFLDEYEDIEKQLVNKLFENNVKEGDDLIVMVVNEGFF